MVCRGDRGLFLLCFLTVDRLLELARLIYSIGVDVELAVLWGKQDLSIRELEESLKILISSTVSWFQVM